MSGLPSSSGLRYERAGACAVLTFDTPDAPVNILTDEAAEALLEHLAAAEREGARAVLLRSAKPRSFLNGARLLAAASIRTPEEARLRPVGLRRVYDALERSPLLKIAVIEGSCFGCGFELTLRCDVRVASASATTHLYMTEIPDYLLTPVFGSTQRLPRLVGLRRAAEVILWGRRLRGADARRARVADALLGAGREERDLAALLARFERSGWKAPARPPVALDAAALDAALAVEEARIARLAPALQPLYRRGLGLLALPLRPGWSMEAAMEEELSAFAETVVQPPATQAIAYFFARQTARAAGTGRVTSPLPPRLTVALERAPGVQVLRRRIERRPIAGLHVCDESDDPRALSLRATAAPTGPAGPGEIIVCGPGRPPPPRGVPALYVPLPSLPEPACEIRCAEGALPDGLVELLEAVDVHPVVTRAAGRWVSDRLLAAWLGPIVAWLARGGPLPDAERALTAFGFAHSPAALFPEGLRLASPTVVDGGGDARPTAAPPPASALVDHVLDSLRHAALACIADGSVVHASQLDVLARTLFGFPLHHGGLLRHLRHTHRLPHRSPALAP